MEFDTRKSLLGCEWLVCLVDVVGACLMGLRRHTGLFCLDRPLGTRSGNGPALTFGGQQGLAALVIVVALVCGGSVPRTQCMALGLLDLLNGRIAGGQSSSFLSCSSLDLGTALFLD